MGWKILDDTSSELGEGILWHPERKALFWFDILGQKLFELKDGNRKSWDFANPVSAAGWVDLDRLLIADSTSLFLFNVETGESEKVVDLEADNPSTRSNDGRADRQGGFWIGTMGKKAEDKVGAIYRYYKGELRKLYSDITIPNAICFSPDGKVGYFADSRAHLIWKQNLDADGWPISEPVIHLDFTDEDFGPDGAVIDAEGKLWNAQWGIGRVACFNSDGVKEAFFEFPASQITCPGFYGEGLTKLAVTSAREDMPKEQFEREPLSGQLFSIETQAKGLPEPKVIV